MVANCMCVSSERREMIRFLKAPREFFGGSADARDAVESATVTCHMLWGWEGWLVGMHTVSAEAGCSLNCSLESCFACGRCKDDLVDEWLLWFTTEDAEPPPVTRLDFLVSWRPDVMPAVAWLTAVCQRTVSHPSASCLLCLCVPNVCLGCLACPREVWTCEVGECGASLCSVECEARNCAVLNWAIRHDASGRFPAALPPIRRALHQTPRH